MMKRRLLLLPLLAGVTAAALSVSARGLPDKGGHGQPIAYNHQLHVETLEIECVVCHRTVETGEMAGRPVLATCLECHEAAITENPEEHKIQKYAETGTEIPWVRLTAVPEGVYFSHRRHVAVAGLACTTCHGAMEKRTTPPERPLVRLTMSRCIECHRELEAATDCNSCHR